MHDSFPAYTLFHLKSRALNITSIKMEIFTCLPSIKQCQGQAFNDGMNKIDMISGSPGF